MEPALEFDFALEDVTDLSSADLKYADSLSQVFPILDVTVEHWLVRNAIVEPISICFQLLPVDTNWRAVVPSVEGFPCPRKAL